MVEKEFGNGVAVMRGHGMMKSVHDTPDVRHILRRRTGGAVGSIRCSDVGTEQEEDDPDENKLFHKCLIG